MRIGGYGSIKVTLKPRGWLFLENKWSFQKYMYDFYTRLLSFSALYFYELCNQLNQDQIHCNSGNQLNGSQEIYV